MKIWPFICIRGRIAFDDEDTTVFYEDKTLEQACELYEHDMSQHGGEVIVSEALASESEIHVLTVKA